MKWLRLNGSKKCSVNECQNPSTSRGMCTKHAFRARKHGDPSVVKIRQQGTGTISSGGYKQLFKPGHPCADNHGLVMEHRFVMCEFLGRPLLPKEKIHHKNGNRLDNRLENLELWVVGAHPAGQRVEDIVALAVQILADNNVPVPAVRSMLCQTTAPTQKLRRKKLPNGYVDVFIPGFPGASANGRIREHRYIMSLFLGRPLNKWENVHHKNGMKSDNRLENLELWCRQQPSGQRASDLIEFAKKVVEAYGST